MARSQKDDPLFADMQHHWNYHPDGGIENRAPNNMPDRQSIPPNTGMMTDNKMFANFNPYTNNEMFKNKLAFNMNGDTTAIDENQFSHMQNIARVNNVQNYGTLNLGNGQVVSVFYDSNRQIMIPVSSQYEEFKNVGQSEATAPSNMFTMNQEYAMNNNNVCPLPPAVTAQNSNFSNDHMHLQNSNLSTSSILKEVMENWAPNSSGTYSPFGQNFPMNHPSTPPMNGHAVGKSFLDSLSPNIHRQDINSKRNEHNPLGDTGHKKRIVAEVKPMRPSYSDVLAKNKNNVPIENARKIQPTNIENKNINKTSINKSDKNSNNIKQSNEDKQRNDKKNQANIISSGSESGDFTMEDTDKRAKPTKKNKSRRNNMSRRWSSLDDIAKEDEINYTEKNSQFVFIENQAEKKKDRKSNESKSNNSNMSFNIEKDYSLDNDDTSQFVYQEGQTEGSKSRKKKENRSNSHKPGKPNLDKKKTQTKWKRNKPGYLGIVQNQLEHWGGATWKALVWFLYLLSDIIRMSSHLSFDLCTSVFTQTYVSSQAVWRSGKDWIHKLKDNKYLLYIDKKLGHTKFGFWRKLKWFKKESESDNSNESSKLYSNIPLPATGEEAMKRLLACKGKDPYSILGVSVSCTDEEIKRYYKRQAFLVHPDKNQQPGAEEAFKILQHAFELIGEPERREAYDRGALESRHVEAAWSELSHLLEQLHDKMKVAANTIRCTNCGRRHKRVATDRPCYAARYCAQCKIRHSAKEGDIWAESSMMGLLVMYYACMDGAVYQITQWASCQKKNLKQLRPDCHVVQYRIVLGNKAAAAPDLSPKPPASGHDPNLEEFLNNLYSKSGGPSNAATTRQPTAEPADAKLKRRNKKPKV